jgi:NLI interacting factor-like phosphatase
VIVRADQPQRARVYIHERHWSPRDGRPIVLVDMDGTLADSRHREHFVTGKRKNWKAFFEAMDADKPNPAIRDWVRQLAADHEIVIVTGRPQEYLPNTVDWLRHYDIPFQQVLMRSAGDHRPDYVVKEEMLSLLPLERVAFVLDDRESVCEMFTRRGLLCHRVIEGKANPTREGS